MAIAFPASPTLNQTTFTGGHSWYWSGKAWISLGSTSSTVVSDSAPSNSSPGVLWFNTSTAVLYTRIAGDWVEIAGGSVSNIPDLVITTSKLADNAVTTAKIQAGAITAAKLDPTIVYPIADGAVTAAKLAADTNPIVLDDISSQFDGSKAVFRLTQNQVLTNSIVDSKDLEVIINGIRLTPWVDTYTYPWQTPYSSFKGFKVDSSNLIIYNAPYRGDSAFLLLRRLSTSRQKQRYPYSATTIAFGD